MVWTAYAHILINVVMFDKPKMLRGLPQKGT